MAATVCELLAADNLADEVSETHQLLTGVHSGDGVAAHLITDSIVSQAEEEGDPVPYEEWLHERG